MPPRAEVLRDRTIGGEEPLRVPWRLEALRAPLPWAGLLVGIHRPPQIVPLTLDRQKHFIQMPLAAGLKPPMPELLRIGLAELATPLADGFIRDGDATGKQQFFHIAVAQPEPEIEPDRRADNLGREPMALVGRLVQAVGPYGDYGMRRGGWTRGNVPTQIGVRLFQAGGVEAIPTWGIKLTTPVTRTLSATIPSCAG